MYSPCLLFQYACLSEHQHESRVFQAVLSHGVSQWFDIGLQLGLSQDQIVVCTYDKPELSSKLQALIQTKVTKDAVRKTEECLLMACTRIPRPIFGSVKEKLQTDNSTATCMRLDVRHVSCISHVLLQSHKKLGMAVSCIFLVGDTVV